MATEGTWLDGTITSPKLVRTVDNAQLGLLRRGTKPAEVSIGIISSPKLVKTGVGSSLDKEDAIVDVVGSSLEVVDGHKAAVDIVGSSPEVVGLLRGIN